MPRSGIVQPNFDSNFAPNPLFPYGEAILTRGLKVNHAIDGMGILTRGLLWELYSVWFDVEYYSPITTTWTDEQLTLG